MIKKAFIILSIVFLSVALGGVKQTFAAGNISLFTPYTGLSVTPGETVDYSIDVINSGSTIQNMSFTMENLPKGWDYSLTANGKDIRELAVRGNSEETINLELTVPLEVKKADYRFQLVASDGSSSSSLAFLVTVSEQGSFETELTSEQTNLQGHADSSFSYTISLKNRTANTQNYALSSAAGEGWNVTFKSGSDSITSVELDTNESKDITVDVKPPENIKAGTYEIPIKAATSSTAADLTLEAVITGTYGIEITTPSGNLSTDITAGDDRVIDLVVKNTGTSPLKDVSISANTPPNWESEFDNSSIAEIAPGESKTVKATIKADNDAIAGDYVTTFTASTAETSSDAAFRISVETSTLWGAVAIIIILVVIGGLYYIFRKYGRR
ncbi:NEW3 domain-containing protein [Caldibacillus lycopersici]|uniref:NEW3 domain-containing protein n=1 Tax=Perspicuibacillus lycopersici TaxID=1325689 RepID=A0AAE3LPZ3_9BACI|nr:NEW3 domain-containing protein [Perspicuibacillus lycopersici]MCU9612864.1 NEW3 domain-containing protein [Perspicuibacillus lycopersici]